ncbi:hypothetical protein N752_15165 [Desulforamulus aquiferis]|nr:hypothetical protein N752_15165 [Desulforamulus aquiferis]
MGAAIATCFEDTGIDLYIGTGGAPEGVISAAAIKALGGEQQGRLAPADQEEFERCVKMGLKDPRQVLMMDDMVRGEDAIFAATGVTDGELLRGVRFVGNDRAETHSIVMRARTKTVRWIKALHSIPNKPHLIME